MNVIVSLTQDTLRDRVCSLLEQSGFSVLRRDSASAIEEALKELDRPALIVLDPQLEPVSGLEICRKLREGLPGPQSYVIFIRADTKDRDTSLDWAAGADDVLDANFSDAYLIRRLQAGQRSLDCQAELIRRYDVLRSTVRERYAPMERLGSGGVGTVYRAFDSVLQREVAMKYIQPDEDTGLTPYESVLREARMMATLNHPNLLTVIDCGENDRGPFLIMEVVEGESLQSMLSSGPMRIPLFRQLVEQSLRGIDTAHALGILHLDLKPSNIMFGFVGATGSEMNVKILDFGLARFRLHLKRDQDVQSNSVYGSIPYIAPERLLQATVDRRADLYSLGHIFFHALVGRHAFQGANINEMLEAHIEQETCSAREIRPEASEALDAWLHRMMAKDPLARFSTAAEALASFPTQLSDA